MNIIIAGDIAECDDGDPGERQTAALVEQLSGIVVTAGDNVYAKGTLAEFRDCYGPTWGSFLDRTRPTPGNHDYYTPNASGYFEYFGDRAGPSGRGYYAFAAASWRVYSLNGGFCMTEEGCGPGTAQYEWLEEQLTARPTECVLAVWHEPRFSSGRHGPNPEVDPLVRLLYREGAELVVNGHDHSYERFAPARPNGQVDRQHGLRQFISGSGGADHYVRGDQASPHSEVFDNTSYGVLRLKLKPGSYDWDFIPVEGSDFTDAGSGNCHGNP